MATHGGGGERGQGLMPLATEKSATSRLPSGDAAGGPLHGLVPATCNLLAPPTSYVSCGPFHGFLSVVAAVCSCSFTSLCRMILRVILLGVKNIISYSYLVFDFLKIVLIHNNVFVFILMMWMVCMYQPPDPLHGISLRLLTILNSMFPALISSTSYW